MIYWIIATVAAYFVKGLCGFANTLVFSSILSFGVANVDISPVELVVGLPSNMLLAFKERKKIRWRLCLPVAALVVVGALPGVYLLKYVNEHYVKIFFGILIILVGIEMLLRDRANWATRSSRMALFIIGLLSGVLCGMFGIGIFLAAYLTRITENTGELKANLCMVFVIENIMRIAMYTASGIITAESLMLSAKLFPFMLVGLVLGMKSSDIIDEKYARKIVIIMIIISGAALLLTNL